MMKHSKCMGLVVVLLLAACGDDAPAGQADAGDAGDAARVMDARPDGSGPGATEPFTVRIASDAAGPDGIEVRVVPNSGRPRFEEGAPVVVMAPGGWGMGSLGNEMRTPAYLHGMVMVEFQLPGGEGDPGSPTYDIRGARSVRACADVMLYAMGLKSDTDGQLITERAPQVLVSEVGAMGSSNGGNLVLTALGNHLSELGGLRWFTAWESPLGDQFAAVELNGNPYYTPGTCTATTCPTPSLGENLRWDPAQTTDGVSSGAPPFEGRVVLDGAMGDRRALFSSHNAGYDESGELRLYPSQELAAMYREESTRLWGGAGPPEWLEIDADANRAFWSYRDGALHIPAVHEAMPDFLVIHLQTTEDHVQSQPDYPHASAHLQGWMGAGHAWVRLNPDSVYIALASGDDDTSGLPDNDANVAVRYPGAEAQMVPEDRERSLQLAGILELADRVHAGDTSLNLDAVLVNYEPEEATGMMMPPAMGGSGGGLDCGPGETERCCGDGVCDGPENARNCPADCS